METKELPPLQPASDVQEQIRALRQGEHLCSVYATTEEMLAQVIPYLQIGLAKGERCIYVADDHDEDCLRAALAGAGLAVHEAVERRSLIFWTRRDYRQPGEFDSNVMYAFVAHTLDQALADGHTAIRLAVEMTWTLDNGVTRDSLVRWEDLTNKISFPGSQVSFICQYNSMRLASDLIRRAVSVHPVVVLGTDVCPNVQYMPSQIVLEETSEDERLQWLVKRLQQDRSSRDIAKMVQTELERLVEQRTTELTRANETLRAEIEQRTRVETDLERSRQELEEKLKDLESFHDLVVGRELKMIELEREVARLRLELSRVKAEGQPSFQNSYQA
jgi:hypothetical protein